MTLGEWLDGRTPPAPPALATRVRDVLGDALAEDAAEAPARLVDAAEQLLDALLVEGSGSRDSAIDLLAVDALVTYAFEAAGETPATLRTRADLVMHRLLALGEDDGGSRNHFAPRGR